MDLMTIINICIIVFVIFVFLWSLGEMPVMN